MNEEIIEVFDDTLTGAKAIAKGMLVIFIFPLRLIHIATSHFLEKVCEAISNIEL